MENVTEPNNPETDDKNSGISLNLEENDDYDSDFDNYDESLAKVVSEISETKDLKAKHDKFNAGKNKTFNYFQIRDIEQGNVVLMKKVLAHSTRTKQYKTNNHMTKISSAEVNRRKLQKKIDHENLVLLKRIQSIKPFGLSKTKATH